MDVTERQHIDVVRAHLIQRYQYVDPGRVENAVETAHHRFDSCRIRDFVPLLVERPAVKALDKSLTIAPSSAYPRVHESP